MVISRCYQPIGTDYESLENFVKNFRNYIETHNLPEQVKTLDVFLEKIRHYDEEGIISPIDRNFSIPNEVLDKWKKGLEAQDGLVPEFLAEEIDIPDYSESLIHAIRVGLSIQKYGDIKKLYLPNPKSYDLSRLPPHVFFDGTMLDRKFLRRKLKTIKFKTFNLNYKPLWKLRVWQNCNTDLPKSTLHEDSAKVERFLTEFINAHGLGHKYFFLTKKAIRENYLENFLLNLKNEMPELDYVLCHYGEMRGINDAKDCDIGVMLGTHILPSSVEYALALELLPKKIFKGRDFIRQQEIWSWGGSGKSKRVYKEGFEVISQLANQVSLSEHRQGLARTRYLFHDVDFYIFSKVMLGEYEPFAQMESTNYREDIFPPRKLRKDNKYEEVKNAATELCEKQSKFRVADLLRITGISRRTAHKYLEQMVSEKFLVRERRGQKGGVYRRYEEQ